MEELENTVADSNAKIKELKKVTKKLKKEATIAKEEVFRLTAVVGEAQKTATQAVEESNCHTQVATLLEDHLDALISKKLEEHGVVREARPQAPPRCGDVDAVGSFLPTARDMELSVPNPSR